MKKKEKVVQWYDRGRLPYAADHRIIEEHAAWLKQVPWKLFCTFTFAWKVSDKLAARIFNEFINRLERTYRSDIGYVRGDEKRFSGCGMPACGRHYHVLLTSVAPLSASLVAFLWREMAGNQMDDAGAKVDTYDSYQKGISYVLKSMNQNYGGWDFRKLHLFHPISRSLQTPNKRLRRHLRRHKEREKQFRNATTPKTWIPTQKMGPFNKAI